MYGRLHFLISEFLTDRHFWSPGRPSVCVCCGEGDGREMDEDGACEDCATQRRYLYATKRFFIVATDDFRDNLVSLTRIDSHDFFSPPLLPAARPAALLEFWGFQG
jgi:hypothetical protein